MNLESLMHEQISIREKIIKLSEKLESIEKEYYYGNKVLVKRYKGEEYLANNDRYVNYWKYY